MSTAIGESESDRTVRLIRARLDSNSLVPLYHQVGEALVDAITSGELPPSSRLGNEMEIGQRLRLSRPTIRRAISMLVDRGLVVRRRGVGSIVMATSVRRNVALTSLYEDLAAMGRDLETRVLGVKRLKANEEQADQLGLKPGADITWVHRLRLVDGAPLAIMENFIPGTLDSVTPESLAEESLYRLMEHEGLRPAVASQEVSARLATAAEAELLEDDRPCAVLTAQRLSYDETGRAIELSHHVFLASKYSFEMNLVRATG